ncbi:MurR/RpiR family transcriptional regulator [Mesorhizobium sp. ASY16-5R]|uniref:MurR/RpiR family transcriptional regulator n=1 Tax=Mesorhizobium sp. ASY16-5R TaxID=3445772 RepID=UPI003F9EF07F
MTDVQAAKFDDALPFRERAGAVNLFPAEQRVVAQLLAIPPYELGAMTSSDLSQRSGASRSSIDRLSRKLGYPGLKEMRKALLLEEARDRRRPASVGAAAERPAAIARRIMSAVASRAESMAETLGDNGTIETLVEWIAGAGSISLFGAGESAATCSAIYMRLVRLGLPINFAEEYHTQVTLAALLNPKDIAIAVSYSGGSRSTLWAARTAKQNGARLAVVTGMPNSALGKLADLRIGLPHGGALPGGTEVLDRLIAGGLAEVLFQCIVARSPELLANSVRIDDIFGEQRI